MSCRHCGAPLEHVFLDLGYAPPSNAYRDAGSLKAPELTFPLKLYVCDRCWLVQTEDYARADELFDSEYAYFSSTPPTWLDAARYFEMARARFALDARSFVIEVASNDGYLLRHFVSAGILCFGIGPTASTLRLPASLVPRALKPSQGTGDAARDGLSADVITAITFMLTCRTSTTLPEA
jgi:hypothetical protein